MGISLDEVRTIATRPDIMDELGQIVFPVGFMLDDLHTMTNLDGKGDVSRQEFIDSLARLVFCDDFQSKCLSQLAMGRIKKLLVEQRTFSDTMLSASLATVAQ